MSSDNVNHPAHYQDQTSLECIEAMEIVLGEDGLVKFCIGNAFKYLWRYSHKNGSEDLEKAAWYLDRAYSRCYSEEDMYTIDACRRVLMEHQKRIGGRISA